MKIGYLFRTFPQLSQTFINNEIDELEHTGHQTVLAALYRPGEGIHPSMAGLERRTLYWRDIDKRCLSRIIKANIHCFLRFPGTYIRLLLRKNGEGIGHWLKKVMLAEYFLASGVRHIHTHFAWEQVDMLQFIQELTGIRYSLTLHAADIFSETHNLPQAIQKAAFALTISEYNRRYLIENYAISPKKIHVVHCGVKIEDFSEPPHTRNSPKILLSIGRMVEKKGFDLFLHGLAILKDRGLQFTARIIGDGPLLSELKEMSNQLGLEEIASFTGPLPHDAVKAALSQCDVFVLACRQGKNEDIDGIPVVLMEAMACAVPVVSTRISGIPELCVNGCGYLAAPDDSVDLAAGMEKILCAAPAVYEEMGKKAREKIVNDFTLQGQARGLLSHIEASLYR